MILYEFSNTQTNKNSPLFGLKEVGKLSLRSNSHVTHIECKGLVSQELDEFVDCFDNPAQDILFVW